MRKIIFPKTLVDLAFVINFPPISILFTIRPMAFVSVPILADPSPYSLWHLNRGLLLILRILRLLRLPHIPASAIIRKVNYFIPVIKREQLFLIEVFKLKYAYLCPRCVYIPIFALSFGYYPKSVAQLESRRRNEFPMLKLLIEQLLLILC